MVIVFASATVQNFQSVESATIEFPSRVSGGSITTIVGPSSTGKSAFLRALHTLVYNTSSVSARTRAGAKTLQVSALLKDGREVRIKRGASLSTYEVGEETYTKAGTTAPEVIADIFRMQPGLHIRFQFSAPYLLSETPAAVAAAFAQLTQARVLREAAREGSRLSLRAKQAAQLQTEEAEKISQILETDFADLPEHQAAVSDIITRVLNAQKLEEAHSRIWDASRAVERATAYASAMETSAMAYRDLPAVQERLRRLSEQSALHTHAQEALRALSRARIDLAVLPTPVPDLTVQLEACATQAKYLSGLQQLVSAVKVQALQTQQHAQVEATAKQATAQLREALAQQRAAIDVCPTCGQVVKGAKA